MSFKVSSRFQPTKDQEKTIKKLVKKISPESAEVISIIFLIFSRGQGT